MKNTKSKITIAIADTQVMVGQMLCKYLEDYCKFEVVAQSRSVSDLVHTLECAAKLPDVCIIPLEMPNLMTYDAIKSIKEKWPEIKLLILSSSENDFVIINALQSGAEGVLPKSKSLIELHKAILEIYNKGHYQSKSFSGRMLQLLLKGKNIIQELTKEELKFIYYCCTELTYKEIADHMNTTPRAIEAHRFNLFKKLKVKSRTGLAMFAIRFGLYTVM